jgi:hypothetical protein
VHVYDRRRTGRIAGHGFLQTRSYRGTFTVIKIRGKK